MERHTEPSPGERVPANRTGHAEKTRGGTAAVRTGLPPVALVAAGGAAGTLLRAALETAAPPAPGGFPWTTFLINIVGSFLLGALQAGLARSGPDTGARRATRIGVGTGIIGGFTTYSTFVLESERLILGSTADTLVGSAYLCASIVAGLGAAAAGILVGGGPHGERRCGRHAGQDAGPAGAEASR